MPVTDPISDMLARLRNAQAQGQKVTTFQASKLKLAILDVLQKEGYINGFEQTADEAGKQNITVQLKYHMGQPVITRISRVSKPGQRVYSASEKLPMVSNGLGVTIVSTSKGVMSDAAARAQKLGGEVLCKVL